MAIVFDIDETLLSNYELMHKQADFGYVRDQCNQWVESADAPALQPACQLMLHAAEQKVAVFLITGRHES